MPLIISSGMPEIEPEFMNYKTGIPFKYDYSIKKAGVIYLDYGNDSRNMSIHIYDTGKTSFGVNNTHEVELPEAPGITFYKENDYEVFDAFSFAVKHEERDFCFLVYAGANKTEALELIKELDLKEKAASILDDLGI